MDCYKIKIEKAKQNNNQPIDIVSILVNNIAYRGQVFISYANYNRTGQPNHSRPTTNAAERPNCIRPTRTRRRTTAAAAQ